MLGIDPSQFVLSAWLFQRLMGVVYCIAFVSLGLQIKGLAGKQGLMPAAAVLGRRREMGGWKRFALCPTAFWLDSSDRALQLACWGGAGLAVLFTVGVVPVALALGLWVGYLSLFTVCPLFLGYQWDILLLEAGFLTIFVAPWRWLDWPPRNAPSGIIWGLVYLLLFRLMFSSGFVKLSGGDATWRGCKALQFHYETQPLPNRVSWYAHWMPCWFHQLSAAVLLAVELLAPCLFFAPPPWRYGAGIATIALMILISATGSYGFFNVLTVVLCVPLFDDTVWRAVIGSGIVGPVHSSAWPLWIIVPIAVLIVILNIERFAELAGLPIRVPFTWRRFLNRLQPWALVNSYGLFARMTVARLEIIVEGSYDGRAWEAYEFKWKPGDLSRAPGHPAPHQPRLDWQMWFAALTRVEQNPWFVEFMISLLEGRPEVLKLLKRNPFPGDPPRYVRAQLFDYHFAEPGAATHGPKSWWTCELVGTYCPRLQLGVEEELEDAELR